MTIQWKDRQGNLLPGEKSQDKTLAFLYNSAFGRMVVSVLIRPWVSKLAGALMDSRISRVFIRRFIRKNHIDMNLYEDRKFRSFNDFFTRQVRQGIRPIDPDPAHLISPCDCKISVYSVTKELQVHVKGTAYTVSGLLRDEKLASEFEGGVFLLLRLTKDDYHRYCYIDDGIKGENVRIPGVYHTVNPIAGERYQIYKENTREYSLLESRNFGKVLMMEVGATMVGRIVNYHGSGCVTRGQEKGRFEFGGSTIILLLQAGVAEIDEDLIRNTSMNVETVIKMGERIGRAL